MSINIQEVIIKMDVEVLKKGIELIESCLGNCERLHFDVNIFTPKQETMDMLLNKDYFKLYFNGDDPDSEILIFHNSEDKYAHNGDIKFTCYLSKVPKVLECVKRYQKVIDLIKEMKKKKGGNK